MWRRIAPAIVLYLCLAARGAAEEPKPGYLGVGTTFDAPSSDGGARMTAVARDSSAARAGIKVADRIVAIDDQKVAPERHPMQILKDYRAGQAVRLSSLPSN